MTIFGISRPVDLNRAIKAKLLGEWDPVKAFSKFITDIQYLDAYSSKQFFYKDQDGNIFGMYTLTEDCDVILPFKPLVEFQNINIVDPKEVKTWKLSLVAIFEDEAGEEEFKTLAILDYLGLQRFYGTCSEEKVQIHRRELHRA